MSLRSRLSDAGASMPPGEVRLSRVWLARALYALLLAGSAAYIASFLVAGLFRLSFPYPLEVNENAAVVQVRRILDGLPLYAAPTLEHVPLIYGPVYFYLSAAIGALTGPTFLPLRLISLLASLGSIGLVGAFVLRETCNRAAALIGAGLMAATYPLGQTSFDLARVDALFVFLLLAGLFVAYFETRRPRPRWVLMLLGGALIGLAGLTKVPIGALPVAAAICLYLLLVRPRSIFAFGVGLGACLAAGVVLLRLQSGPWPTWFLWNLPRMHAIREELLGRFWFVDILPRFTFALVLGPLFLVGRLLEGHHRPALFYGLALTALMGVAWASRSNNGASTNVLLPAFAAIAVLVGLGAHELMHATRGGSPRTQGFQMYGLTVLVLQLALLGYNPRLTVPYRSDQAADLELADRLASLPAPLLAPDLEGYVAASAPEQPYLIAVGELDGEFGGQRTPEGAKWWAEVAQALNARRFQSVVLRDEDCCQLQTAVLSSGYSDAGPLFDAGDQFWLNKSAHTPDVHLYLPPR